jgi:hypothetical protein
MVSWCTQVWAKPLTGGDIALVLYNKVRDRRGSLSHCMYSPNVEVVWEGRISYQYQDRPLRYHVIQRICNQCTQSRAALQGACTTYLRSGFIPLFIYPALLLASTGIAMIGDYGSR